MRYLKNALPQRSDAVVNSAGGLVWVVDNWKRLERFLVLGSESGTYYTGERQLTVENVTAVRECLRLDGPRVVKTAVEISASGRALRNDPALFVLALACSAKFADRKTNAAALEALPQVARTGTHLCNFAAFVENTRGWGRSLRSAVGAWYLAKPAAELAYQILKYQSRNRWSHRDLLRLAHPKASTPAQNALFQWAANGETGHLATPQLLDGDLRQVHGFELAKKAHSEHEMVRLVEDYRLTHEMVPSRWKNSAAVWEALLEQMPYLALVRHLGKLTAVGLLQPQSTAAALVVARLIDRKRVANSRVHPVALLAALLTYKKGTRQKGGLEWAPVANVIDALEEAFYLAFDNVEPSGRRVYLAIDASGSMHGAVCSGMPYVSPAMASAAMAMAFARAEKHAVIAAFHERVWHVDITRKDRLDRACEAIVREPLGTNAALPMQDALDRRIPVDAFVLLTDSETWAGDRHPAQALECYRQAAGIPAKLVVVAMAANTYTIADPADAFQMDVAGFDSSVPAVVSNFLRVDPI